MDGVWALLMLITTFSVLGILGFWWLAEVWGAGRMEEPTGTPEATSHEEAEQGERKAA